MEVRKNTPMDTATGSNSYNDAEFWLPTHFLTDDDFLVANDNQKKHLKNQNQNQPTKSFDLFSNGFDPFGCSLDSPVSSSETDKDHDYDENDLLAELTRQLARSTLRHSTAAPAQAPAEKPWMFSTSPQSTLAGFAPWSNRSGFSSNGSPSQVPSPPLTPPGAKDDAAWELLYEAAGQVARLKMNAMAAQLKNQQQQNRALFRNSSFGNTKSAHINGFYDLTASNQYQQELKRQQGREELYCHQQHHHNHHHRIPACGGGALGLPTSAWPPLRAGAHQQGQPTHHHQTNQRQQSGGSGMRMVFLGSGPGPGAVPPVKKSTGTGVFLPRRVDTTQPEPRKKPSGCSTVLLPARVVQALNLDLDEINNGVNHNSHSRFGAGFLTDHDVMVARRNALLSQQRRSMKPEGAATMVAGGVHDIRLPSDWTY